MFDSLDLSLLNDLAELQVMLERGPSGGDARWQLLQTWLSDHKNVKRHLESCLEMEAPQATDHIFTELAFELTGARITPAVIKFAAKEKYEEYRPKVESTVGLVLGLYAERKARDEKPRKVRQRKGTGKKKSKS